ncbi:hypothetical protein B7494_g6037 [Chlorociboria aeruginascens]|nr:hypothetical protein B7494_g6037 [Chlorociboria aeruginascens]
MSSKATRILIRTHHTLEKQRAKALKEGDEATATAIAQQIANRGGLKAYQRASLLGQNIDRGGDSSKMLMDWVSPVLPVLNEKALGGRPMRLLEVGALSTTNACSKSRLFEVERIDLNSQAEGIKQQDFLERPLPTTEAELFDIISLSLVLNFVPEAGQRGEMLRRTTKFLRGQKHSGDIGNLIPSLFLVLPSSCVTNSRYMDETKLEAIMESLGYAMVKKKLSKKLVYYLFRRESFGDKGPIYFKKVEIRTGKSRNNFAIVLN